jgi:cell division protein FtsI (penicillin-binding protein 3)
MAIVMDSQSGEVLAMTSLVAGEKGQAPQPASSNRALTAVFEPGSVNKMITIAGALEEGLVGPADKLAVPGTIRVGNHTFSEHDPHPTQAWSITDIVANSSNVGSIMIGQKLGKERLDRYLRAFGLGERTAIGFPGESGGLLLDPDHWYSTSMGATPIGQGLAVTAMQMLAAYNTIATGGEYVSPKLLKATVDGAGRQHLTPPSARRRVVSEQTAREMTAMLTEVVRVGTAKLAKIDGYTVAGKTGTARKPDEHVRGYKAGAYFSSFAGFVPAEKPALTAIVVLDEPTPIFGGLVAAPRFAQIAKYALRELRIPPPSVVAKAAAPRVSPEAARPVGEADVPVTARPNTATTLPRTAPPRSP